MPSKRQRGARPRPGRDGDSLPGQGDQPTEGADRTWPPEPEHPATIRVVVVDDHPAVLEGFGALLDTFEDVEVLAAVADAAALKDHVRAEPVDVVVVAERLGGRNTLRLCQRLAVGLPRTRVIVTGSQPSDARVLAAFKSGATGYVVTEAPVARLHNAVRAVHGGGTYVDPSIAQRIVRLAFRGTREPGPHGLTVQEMRVLALLGDGVTNRDIADDLGLSPETVKTHLSRAMRKLKVTNRRQAARAAEELGLRL